uniref:Uncharacterized protein n=1 Tax=Rhizophora mucronata TaxID=61149 RepID=A0A2P2QNG8_RHIMU
MVILRLLILFSGHFGSIEHFDGSIIRQHDLIVT